MGVVSDGSGGSVEDAQVEVLNEATSQRQVLKTNQNGRYNAPYLPSGKYSIVVHKTGFRSSERSGVQADSNAVVRVDFQLEVGAVEQAVTVRADEVALKTDQSSVESAIGADLIRNIPNASQNPLWYAALQPGVTPRAAMSDTTSPTSIGVGYDGRRRFAAFNINGGNAFTNEIQLDGVSVLSPTWGESAVLPNTDGLSEVRVLTNNFSAEYGRGQGVVTMTTKSGTNEFHGSAYYRHRNDAFNANTFANNSIGVARLPFKQHDGGGTFGGPILRKRLFGFVSFERLTRSDTPQWWLHVPTALERTGDFSQTLVPGDNGQPTRVRLFNPYSVTRVADNLYRRDEYPNATIPNPDPFGLRMFNAFPLPNREPLDPFGRGNFFATEVRRFRRDSLNARLDAPLGRHSLYLSAGFTKGAIRTPRVFGDDSPFYINATDQTGFFLSASRELIDDNNPYGSLGDTIIISPTLVADIRYGITRIDSYTGNGANNSFDYQAWGLPETARSVVSPSGFAPDIWLTPAFSPGWFTPLSQTSGIVRQEYVTSHNINASLTKTAGNMTLKFGGEFRVSLNNPQEPVAPAGALHQWFNGNATGGSFNAELITANGSSSSLNNSVLTNGSYYGAKLLTGAGTWYNPGNVLLALAHKYAALYVQDDWRVSRKLTLNLGLRWEVQPSFTERYDRITALDLQSVNPYGGQGVRTLPGTNGYERNLWRTNWRDFGPRLGFAYLASSNLVVRGGYGLTYVPTNSGYQTAGSRYGSTAKLDRLDSQPFGLSPNGLPIGRFWENAPSPLIPGVRDDLGDPALYGSCCDGFDYRGMRNGRVHQWNVFVERRLGAAWLVSAGYIGAEGRKLLTYLPLNSRQFVDPALLNSWRQIYIETGGVRNPGTELVPNPYQPASGRLSFPGPLGNATITRELAATRYPFFEGANLTTSNGFSSYHALQIRVDRALRAGLLIGAHYTWSKSLGFTNTILQNGGGFDDSNNPSVTNTDQWNLDNNRHLSVNDIPHRLVVSFAYDLPFGRGALSTPNRLVNALLSGWTVGGVGVVQSGTPFGPSGPSAGALFGRTNRVPGVPLEVPKELQRRYDGRTTVTLPSGRRITPCNGCFLKYNSDAFRSPFITTSTGRIISDLYWTGDAAPTYDELRNPGRSNFDATVTRTIALGERVQMQIVANATNLFNHTQFSAGYNGNLGNLVTQSNPAAGILPGYGNNSSFGTTSNATFEPRQIILEMRLRF